MGSITGLEPVATQPMFAFSSLVCKENLVNGGLILPMIHLVRRGFPVHQCLIGLFVDWLHRRNISRLCGFPEYAQPDSLVCDERGLDRRTGDGRCRGIARLLPRMLELPVPRQGRPLQPSRDVRSIVASS